jgi:hypothetical protein
MSSLAAAGKLEKSRLEDPTQCSGFSSAAGTRRTSYYPSSGIITQAVMSVDPRLDVLPTIGLPSSTDVTMVRRSVSGHRPTYATTTTCETLWISLWARVGRLDYRHQ